MRMRRDTSAGTMDVPMIDAMAKFGRPLRRSGVQALALALALFSAFLWNVPARADKRVALVIGNADYHSSSWTRLNNAVNDATDIGVALSRLGFEVTLLKNAGKAATVWGLGKFSKAAAGAELALIFYAGHSIEVDKRNFLIPVDVSTDTPGSAAREAVPLESLLQASSKAKGLGLVLLDACRDNPFADNIAPERSTHVVGVGLGPPADVPGEILVSYSAKAGAQASDGVGRNSPYTSAILSYIKEPGLEVGVLLRMVRDAVVAASEPPQEPSLYESRSSDQYFFEEATELAAPQPELAGPALTENLLDLTQRQRQRIQVALWAQGFYPGLPTGRFDELTRKKIAEWQSYYGRDGTGFLNRESADSLLAEVADPSGPIWLKTADQPCTVWIARPEAGAMTATWSGDCVADKASGRGRLLVKSSLGEKAFDGEMRDGKLHGRVTMTILAGGFRGRRYEGELRDGRRHGRGIETVPPIIVTWVNFARASIMDVGSLRFLPSFVTRDSFAMATSMVTGQLRSQTVPVRLVLKANGARANRMVVEFTLCPTAIATMVSFAMASITAARNRRAQTVANMMVSIATVRCMALGN